MSQLFASGGQSFSFNISPSSEHPGLASFRVDWLDIDYAKAFDCVDHNKLWKMSKGLSRVFSNTTVQKHEFFGAQPSSQSNSHIHP